jgi:hypothetical protein
MALINHSLFRRRVRESMQGQSTQIKRRTLLAMIEAAEMGAEAVIAGVTKQKSNQKRIGHIPKHPKPSGTRRRKSSPAEQPALL